MKFSWDGKWLVAQCKRPLRNDLTFDCLRWPGCEKWSRARIWARICLGHGLAESRSSCYPHSGVSHFMSHSFLFMRSQIWNFHVIIIRFACCMWFPASTKVLAKIQRDLFHPLLEWKHPWSSGLVLFFSQFDFEMPIFSMALLRSRQGGFHDKDAVETFFLRNMAA